MNNEKFYLHLEKRINKAFDGAFNRKQEAPKVPKRTTDKVPNLPDGLREVYSVLSESGVPMGRRQVIESIPGNSVNEKTWGPIIEGLKELGLVTQTGAKRGTKYTAN